MSVDERQEKLIRSLVIQPGRVGQELSTTEFLRQFPASVDESKSLALRLLEDGLAKRDAEVIELGITSGFRFGMREAYIPLLERLAVEDFHFSHEDVVFKLGKLRSPTSVEPLFRASERRHEYLEYNDQYSLRSKIIHALGNIGTLEACSRLEELAQRFEDPELIAKIGRRFRALVETSASEEVRARARDALSRLPPAPDDDDELA